MLKKNAGEITNMIAYFKAFPCFSIIFSGIIALTATPANMAPTKLIVSELSATYFSNIFYHTTSQGVANLSNVFWNENFKKNDRNL